MRADLVAAADRQRRGIPSDTLPSAAFSGFCKKYVDDFVKVRLKPSTVESYELHIKNHLVPYFGHRQLVSITRADVDAFVAHMTRKKKPDGEPFHNGTINNALFKLRAILGAAVDWNYLRTDPTKGVGMLPVTQKEIEFWEAGQIAHFLSTAARLEPGWYPLFATAFRSGLRSSELIALHQDDLDLHGWRIHVQRAFWRGQLGTPKGGKDRWVDIPESLVQLLREARHLRGPFLFCGEDGSPLARHHLAPPWKRIVRASELSWLNIHGARHSYASLLVRRGVPLTAVQQLLGHASITTTQRYAHLAPRAIAQFVAVLDQPVAETEMRHKSGTPPAAAVLAITESGGERQVRTARMAMRPARFAGSDRSWCRSDSPVADLDGSSVTISETSGFGRSSDSGFSSEEG